MILRRSLVLKMQWNKPEKYECEMTPSFQSSLRDELWFVLSESPAINRWAIVNASLRDELWFILSESPAMNRWAIVSETCAQSLRDGERLIEFTDSQCLSKML